IGAGKERGAQIVHAVEPCPVDELPGSIDRARAILVAPAAVEVEVLEREADRIHDPMTGCAVRVGAMQLELLAHGHGPGEVGAFLQILLYTRRGLGNWGTEQRLHHPGTALDGRGAVPGRGDCQNAALPEQAATRRARG